MDDANGVGLLEPVGCHPESRRRGLTQFVILEGLQRLWARGAKQAIVRVHSENLAARQLYRACGFSTASTSFGHEKRIV
jgi:ribosomal protein S18 acetylase RimI-like enzyme